ncbi:MAG: hypothetical protein A3C27_02500 [Candidatus Levybacteria bacterium RIFCSPHIGHO2_02_FULL_39_36]|nr:MAG: hypothetical protein UT20_C0027G0009 [Candidatus Levybacteria bacterium GW2011_GWA1_39_11]OGH28548.1 MAG: hypothetical protein A3C27_02500 [Candidatus Levybacteria bacterium RIFCSPHIGHO2_02_FULL_39_36]OGH35922.1 MAG: hypothetical protein A3B43_00290 [Candidatus Levybacteria bacterium RIFCSPLOWO2_01_FULL_38_120]OGH45602.1 MAG: hypothetical protein A3H82_00180 [Candidatus Levybacteria bacterium RIFCSPLOWO2_02_FULL_39_26]OGH47611.1 MAG: hypothetical protein A3G66_01280 [Candidatus Levybact
MKGKINLTQKENAYSEWFQKIKEISDSSAKTTESQKETPDSGEKQKVEKSKLDYFFIITILLLALIPRLYFLFFVSGTQNAGVGWYGDTYHHWQIAYFTKEIGFSHGFLRLWDLKGMEYFWGLAHPLTLSVLMMLTGINDIVLTRLLSLVTGSLSVLFLYLLGKKYWNRQAGVAAAVLGALNPVSIFNDASGMVEPFGMLFLFMALYLWPKKAFLVGVLLVIASMARAEFWLFSLGIIFSILVFTKEHIDKKVFSLISYTILILVYMKYLLNQTGNAFYPIWWNFLGNAAGEWQADIPLTPTQVAVQPIWIGMFIISLIGILYILWKRPPSILVHLLGLGSFLFLGFFVGLTEYIKSYVHYFWVVRIFSLPYLYLALLIAIIFFSFIPKFIPIFGKLRIGWAFVIGIVIATQLSWLVIFSYFEPTKANWDKEVKLAKEIKQIYKGGTVLIHEGDPVMTYALIKYTGLKGKNIEGQMYDPFQYKPFTDRPELFSKWNKDRKLILNWLKKDNIKLLIFHSQRERYLELVKREPGIFKFVKDGEFGLKIYEVKL